MNTCAHYSIKSFYTTALIAETKLISTYMYMDIIAASMA